MKYYVNEIAKFATSEFQRFEEEVWEITPNYIKTGNGALNIEDWIEVEQNGLVGIQLVTNGELDVYKYADLEIIPIEIKTVAIMKKPYNVWLWMYMFDEFGRQIATFCGHEELDGFAEYIQQLKYNKEIKNRKPPYKGPGFETFKFSEERVEKLKLSDGYEYSGWGHYEYGMFLPNGCGKKYLDGNYVYGNFEKGVLCGPAINSFDTYMYTLQWQNNRGNGWGLCMVAGKIVEFGYYKEGELQENLVYLVSWYLEKMKSSERDGESLLHVYVNKESKEVTTLLIGYKGENLNNGLASAFMGFRFTIDGSVWVGNTMKLDLTGSMMHFKPSGHIEVGKFEKGTLIESMDLQSLIDIYYGTVKFDENSKFAKAFNILKTRGSLEREKIRSKFNGIEIKTEYSYFRNNYEDELPF